MARPRVVPRPHTWVRAGAFLGQYNSGGGARARARTRAPITSLLSGTVAGGIVDRRTAARHDRSPFHRPEFPSR